MAIKLEQENQLIDFDTLSKTVESTVVRAFKGVVKNLQSSLKLELEIPTDLRLKKDSLDKDIRKIQSEINNAYTRVQRELQDNIDSRWRLKEDKTSIKEIEEHKNARLKVLNSVATFNDDGSFKLNDSKDLRKFIQNIKAYEQDIKKLMQLRESNGEKYKPDENDIDLQKYFRGYKITNTEEANVKAMAKRLADIFKQQLNTELSSKQAERVDVTQQINRAVARAAQNQEGVGYEYSKAEYDKAVEKANAAQAEVERTKLEIAKIVQSEIDAYVEMQQKINDPQTSPSNVKLLKEKEQANLSKLKSVLNIIKEYQLDISRLNEADPNNPEQSIFDRLQKLTNRVAADGGFAQEKIKAYTEAQTAAQLAERSVEDAQSYLDTFKQLILSLKDTNEMREVVNDIAGEQIQSSVQDLEQKNAVLQERIKALENEIAKIKPEILGNDSSRDGIAMGAGAIQGNGVSGSNINNNVIDTSEFQKALTSATGDVITFGDVVDTIARNISTLKIESGTTIAQQHDNNTQNDSKTNIHTDISNTIKQEKELATAKQQVANVIAEEAKAQSVLNAEVEKSKSIGENHQDSNSLSVQQKITEIIKEQSAAKASVTESEEKLATVGAQVADQVQSETKALSEQKTAVDQLVASSEKRVAISMRDIELQAQAEQSARRQAEAQEANYKAAEAAAQQAKLEAAALKQSSVQSSMSRASSFRDAGLQLQAEQSAERQTSIWRENSKLISDVANQTQIQAAAQQRVNKAAQEATRISAQLAEKAFEEARARVAAREAAEQEDKVLKQQKPTKAQDPSPIFKEYYKTADRLSKVYENIAKLEAKQQFTLLNEKEVVTLQSAKKEAQELLDTIQKFAVQGERGTSWIKNVTDQFDTAKANTFNQWSQTYANTNVDSILKVYDSIANLEAKQGLTGLTSKESASLQELRTEAQKLLDVIHQFASSSETGAKWFESVSGKLDAGKAESVNKYAKAYSNLAVSLGELISKDVKQADEVLQKLQEHVDGLGGGKLSDFSWISRDAKGVDHFAAQFEAADGKAKQLNATLNSVDGSLRVIVQDSKQNASLLDQFMSGLGKRWQSLLQYLGTFASFYKVVDIIKRGVGIVKELDAAFVELKRISNDSVSALEDFRRRQFELADTVGSTSATIINAATEWEHLGYSIKEAEELAKTSAVYKNIADGMTSDSEATEDLVSILKAYNKDAKDAMDVTDALIATSNNYAVTAADIGNILKRSSAALAMGGNTFEETVALGTAMNEVLQQAEVAGSSLKVLSLRLRSSKTELADMGEETDNLVESTPKLRAQIKALTKGFDILESDGKTIKSTYDIMKGIASVWEDMSDVNQAALLELIAGKTRAQGVSALLSNWKQVDNVLQTIAEDEGTALRNNEAKLNTINGRVIQLTNASQKLAQDAFNVDVIKGFISGVTGAVNALDALIRKIGVIPTALGAIGAASSFTKGGGLVGALSDIIDKRAQGRSNLQKLSDVSFTGAQQFVLENLDKYDVGKATKELGELSEAQKMVFDYMSANPGTSYKDALSSLRGEAEKASKTLFSFGNIGQTAFKLVGNAVLGMAAGAALQAVVKTISDAISYQDRLNQSASNYAAQMSSAQQSIAGYKTQIQDLSAKINDQNSSIEEVTKARESLRSLQAEMIDVYGREADGIDIVTQAINGNIDALDRLEAAQFRRQKGQMISEHSGLGDKLGRFFSDIFDWNMGDTGNVKHDTVSNDIKDKIEEYSINFSQAFKDTSNIAIVEALEKSKAAYKWESNNVTGDVRDITATLQDMTSAADKEYRAGRMTDEEYSKFTNTISGMLAKVQETYDANIDWYNDMMRYDVIANDEKLNSSYKKLESLAKKYRDNTDSEEARQRIIDEYNNIIDGINNSDSIDQNVKRYFNELYPSLKAEVGQWEFESKLALKIDDGKIKSEIQKTLDELQATIGDKTITKEMLDNWDDAAHDTAQNTAYANYTRTLYANGASQVSAGNEAVASAGMLSTDNIEAFKQSIAPELQKALAGVDQSLLAAVKDVNNLPSKFGQAFKKVSKNVGSETDRINAALRMVAKEATQTAKTTEKELGGMDLSDVAKHLSKLNDVYDKLKKDGKVKWDTIDTKDFKEAFGDIKDETGDFQKAWDNFHKTLSSTPNDTKAVQEAFDVLASAYVYNSECLDMLNENNADLIEGMLSDNGVLNASEVVAYALDQKAAAAERDMVSEQMLTQTGYDLTTMQEGNINVTLEQMAAFLQSEQAANLDKQAIANLVLQQAVLNGSQITTDGSVNALIQLAQAANMTASQIVALNNVMAGGSGGVPAGMSADEWDQVYDKEAYYKSQAEKVWTDFKDAEAPKLKLGGGGGGASSGGGGGGGGGGNKEPSKTDKEFDYVNRYLQILQEQNEELRGKVDNQYVILQDAEDNAAEFSDAIGRLGEAEQELNSLGVYYGEDEFTEFLKTLDLSDTAETLNENVGEIEDAYKEVSDIYDDTPGLVHPVGYQDGDTFLGAEIEDYDKVITAAKKYKKALSDVEKAKDKTSKTLDENGTGQLTFIKQLQESDKQLIAAYEHAADSYKTEWEDYKDKILEAFKEDGKGEKYIQDIMFGNLDPEEWERMITYDSNDQTMKDNVELLERAQTAYDHNKESLKSMREWQQKLNDDVQKEYEMRLNIVKAEMTEIESRMNEAQHDLDMKEILGEVVQEADYQRLINISEEQVANYEKQLDVLNEQLGTLDEGEQAWYDCKSQIADCEQNIRECVKQQAEWNDTILRMPVENISRFLGLIQNLGQTLKNWLSVNDAKGIAQNAEQIQTSWTTAFDQVADDELGLMKQLEDYEELLENYDLGSTKFSEVDDEIQSARDSVEQLVEEMIELNKQLLTIPIDKISEMTTYLDGTLSDLQSIQSEYETTINTVIDLITKQQEDLEEEYNELEKSIEDQIKPLQDQLDLLGKQNDQRDRELAIENALFELEKAREQKTVQVIRDGRVQYEVDESAVRNAQQGYDDALYNKLTGDLQDKIDDLNDQLEKARESTDDQVQALEDMKKNRWETIIPDTERARNEEIATQVFTNLFGATNWKELVLAGQDARGVFADEAIYQGMRQSYGTNSEQQRDTQRQIDINNIITESLTRLVEDFQADKINSEELSAKVSTLMNFVNDGLITGQERLENTLSLGDYSNLGAALTDASRQRNDQMDIFNENLAIAQENRDQVNELIGRWDDFKVWYDETYKQLYEQYKKIDFIGDTVAKWYSDSDDDDDDYEQAWGVTANDGYIYTGETGFISTDAAQPYADGLERGSVGGMTSSQKFKAIQALGLRKLDPDEFPAILHLGEGVINPKQQSTMLGNMRQALALGGAGTGAVIQMSFGDITLPSVTNGQDFAESLATQFQPAMNQVFQKIFRR